MENNVTFEVSFQGDLFNRGVNVPRIEQAIAQTLDFGVDIIRQRTPVRSGLLQSQWNHDCDSIFNNTFYTNYVESGTKFFVGRFMVRRSLDEIKQKFVTNVTQLL